MDFKGIFAKKGIDYPHEYKLLEVCNPQAAKRALDSDPNIGLLLGCYAKNKKSYNGSCDIVGKNSGLLIVIPDTLDKLLTKVFVTLKENEN